MYLNLNSILRLAALLVAVALTWLIARQQRAELEPAPSRPLPPGYYLKSAVLAGTDINGKLLYNVAADLAEQQPQENRILLSNVRVNYRPAAQVPWDIRSQNGVADLDQAYMDLFGQVELTSAPQPPETKTMIFTNSLRLMPEEFIAQTPDRVRIQMGGRQLRATGLIAYLKDDRLELQSNVNGQFRP